MKRRKLGRSGIRLRNNLILLGILAIVVISIFMILNKNEKEDNQTQYAMQTQQLIQANNDIQNNTEGTTYYVSAQGTSTEGTNINNPMSLETANAKIYNANDKILFKSGDTFYGTINFNTQTTENEYIYIGSYGEGEKPIISGAKIVSKEDVWEKEEGYDNIYKIDLANKNNFEGIDLTTDSSCNVGFILDKSNNIYGNRKKTLDLLENNLDFYCDSTNLYVKCNENPIKKLGTLKIATNVQLFKISSNTIADGLRLVDTGAHAIVKKSYPIKNVYIRNCVIENIGGSVQKLDDFVRYGNAIEFWCGAENVLVERNIIKNVYDAAITLQGDSMNFSNINIRNNILIANCYSFELWASGTSTGMTNVNIYDNITINQGKGWGQEVRPNPYNSAEYVFYAYAEEASMDINIYNNSYYNSTRLYYILYTLKDRFKEKMKVDNNKFREQEEIYIVNDNKNEEFKEYLNKEYNIDKNSTFRLLTNKDIIQINNQDILASNDYTEIKTYYETLEKDFTYTDAITPIHEKYTQFKQQNQTIINQTTGLSTQITQLETYLQQANSTNLTQDKLTQQIKQNYELGTAILTKYLNNELNITEDELITILQQINEMGQTYNTLYSLLQTEETIDFTDLQNQITETEKTLGQYQQMNLTQVATLIDNTKTTMQSDLKDTIKSTAATYLVKWSQKLLDIDIINYITQNPPTLSYSTITLTNKNVTATLTANYDIQITNNNNSPTYTFTQNGSFTFQYTVNNKPYQVTATVTNIDKIAPKIEGVEDGQTYYIEQQIIPKITDINLKEVTLQINGVQIDYEIGEPLIVEGIYKLTATDEAGNTKTIQFQVMEKPDEKYIMQENSIQNIKYNTTKTKFDTKIKLQETYTIERKTDNETIQLKSTDTIASGDILTTASGKKYTLIVAGDLTKDGVVDIQDFVRMRRYLLGLRELDEVETLAADANVDSKDLSISDYIRIRIFILNQLAEN